MPRTSETVAALASALAKAQAVLINPEKSLTATIRAGRPGEGGGRFGYGARARLTGRWHRSGLAVLSDRRDRQSAAHGRRPDLRSPLRPVHARGHRWRG